MNADRFQWPSEIPRLLWPLRKCPLCTSVEFVPAEKHLLDHTLSWIALHPLRCVNCWRRYYAFSVSNVAMT
jgi:hypothetical protein